MQPLGAVTLAVMLPIDQMETLHSTQKDMCIDKEKHSRVEGVGPWVFKAGADTYSSQPQELGIYRSRL